MYKVRNVEGGMLKLNLKLKLNLNVETTCDGEFGKELVTNSFLA